MSGLNVKEVTFSRALWLKDTSPPSISCARAEKENSRAKPITSNIFFISLFLC